MNAQGQTHIVRGQNGTNPYSCDHVAGPLLAQRVTTDITCRILNCLLLIY